PARRSVFTHIEDNISDGHYDREKVLIVIHPQYRNVWYWLIPFSNGRCSLGVVAEDSYFAELGLEENSDIIKASVEASPELSLLLHHACYDTEVRSIAGYSSDVTSLWGNGYALLGNAGEFLDPVFSSGVTIAMKSASLAAPLVSRQLKGGKVDWQSEYAVPLKRGVDTFRAFVDSWYQGSLQRIIFSENQSPVIREMLCSILAGYAWDEGNPFVQEPERRLRALAEICATV
ncbi:MAG: tryptophan 7-halogenase, partial [Porticoccus sp.]|nr:tryptophan 7-halogenase [Porticoccus sp.]MBQ0806894.1 tryptophan 7-halogenase [Porticoccus sp.]